MAKTKTKNQPHKQRDILRSTNAPLVKSPPSRKSQRPIEDLLAEAAELLEQSQPDLALPLAEEALHRLETERRQNNPAQGDEETDLEELLSLAAQGVPTLPTVLVLNAEIKVALGDIDSARRDFLRATRIDKDGALISAEPWLWLAQLCEEGGRGSIHYFDQACEVLRNEIEVLEEAVDEMHTSDTDGEAQTKKVLDEKKSKLADALCAMAEVYMTDLSWEPDAEKKCETWVTEAVVVCPDQFSAGVLQTLASVRISQERIDDARTALKRSLDIWHKDGTSSSSENVRDAMVAGDGEADEDTSKPDFATRVSLCRLLMEVQLEQLAFSVLKGLVGEDDQSVECWYLGGWCEILIGQKPHTTSEVKLKSQRTARTWLENCLRLYRLLDYEDERLREHTTELVDGLKKELGADEDGDDDWEDVDGQEDGDDDNTDVELEVEDEANGQAENNAADEDVEMT